LFNVQRNDTFKFYAIKTRISDYYLLVNQHGFNEDLNIYLVYINYKFNNIKQQGNDKSIINEQYCYISIH